MDYSCIEMLGTLTNSLPTCVAYSVLSKAFIVQWAFLSQEERVHSCPPSSACYDCVCGCKYPRGKKKTLGFLPLRLGRHASSPQIDRKTGRYVNMLDSWSLLPFSFCIFSSLALIKFTPKSLWGNLVTWKRKITHYGVVPASLTIIYKAGI